MSLRLCTFFLVFISIFGELDAQKVYTRQGNISFFSDAPMEKIEAHNHKATCVLDLSTGQVEWAVLIKAFAFEKALMQEHFNENYMESGKYPKASFKGQLQDYQTVDLSKDGQYRFNVTGDLTIRDQTRKITTGVVLNVKQGQLSVASDLTVKVADYGIEIPQLVRENIAKEVAITIGADLELLEKKS